MRLLFTTRYLLILLVVFGMLFSLKSIYNSFAYSFISYVASPARAENTAISLPTFINIPIIETAMPIDETSINFGVWEVKENEASHLASSAVPGENGNIIMYAPNTEDGFKRLSSLTDGDKIFITTLNGNLHTYIVDTLDIVSPLELNAIRDTEKEKLTLYTTYGFAGLKRFVVRAIPQENTSN